MKRVILYAIGAVVVFLGWIYGTSILAAGPRKKPS